MCLYSQAPDEAAEEINLSQKVPIATPEETAPAPTEKEEENVLPEWSEKVASGILTGKGTLFYLKFVILSFGVLSIGYKYRSIILTDSLCVILLGASWLSWGLVKGAAYTGKAIHKGASMLREHITPEDKPTQVSPTVTKSLHVAKQATGGAVKVSQFLGNIFIVMKSFFHRVYIRVLL